MSFKLKGSHLIAAAICAGIGGWMYAGEVIEGGQSGSADKAVPIVEREAKRSADLFKVRVKTLQPQERKAQLLIRGRTEADATITVRAETGGTLEKRVVKKGDQVKAGDLLCVLDQGVRKSNLAQAEASLVQAKEDYLANRALVKKGFTTKAKLRAMKSGLDRAVAALEAARQDLARTEIRATVSGEVTSPLAEPGDNLSPGGICVTLIDTNPMLFIGQVSERNIADVAVGMNAGVQLVTGEQILGKISYTAPNADPRTRTFRVEIELPNPQHKLRDGVTASSIVQLASTKAYLVKSSWLTLADNGEIGVRGVDQDDKVVFVKVAILSQTDKGLWVSGIEPGMRVITLGHEFVVAGERVKPITKEQQEKMLQDKADRKMSRGQGFEKPVLTAGISQ